MQELQETLLSLLLFSIPVLLLCGWLQHLYTCFTEGMWGFLVAGALFFPVGIIHGLGIMLGMW